MRVGHYTNAFGVSHEPVSDNERTRSVPSLNVFGFSLERVWLLIQKRLASRLNVWLLI